MTKVCLNVQLLEEYRLSSFNNIGIGLLDDDLLPVEEVDIEWFRFGLRFDVKHIQSLEVGPKICTKRIFSANNS